MAAKLTAEQATALVMSVDGPPHAEVVARVGPGIAWDASQRKFVKVTIDPETTATDLLDAGVAEPTIASPQGTVREPVPSRSRRKA